MMRVNLFLEKVQHLQIIVVQKKNNKSVSNKAMNQLQLMVQQQHINKIMILKDFIGIIVVGKI